MTYEAFISRFPKSRPHAKGVMVVCPAHQDSPKGPSLSVGSSQDGKILLKCFAGCTSEAVVSALGLSMKDLFPDTPDRHFVAPTPRQTPANTYPEEKPVIEKVYSYRNHLGDEVYQVVRLIPKTFRQRHMVNGKWVWSMDGVERVLYRLPQIMEAQQVWIVEGEKDADNLVALGFEASCNVGGAGKWLGSYSESLAGKDVVICGDNDEAGAAHVKLVFESIMEVAKSVRIIKLPDTGKDVSDLISSFKQPEDAKAVLLDLVSSNHPHIKGHHLPVYSVGELEADYRRFVRSMSQNSFSLGKWLPTFSRLRSLVPGELVVIIGDTGTGKTAILANIAKAAADLPAVMFEMELPKEMMFERCASMLSKMTGDDIEKAYQSSDDSISDLINRKLSKLCICPISRLDVKKIEEIINRSELKLGERPRIVLIDYIQLISAKGANRREKMSDIAEELKIIAKTTRTIIIVASQIARPQNVDDDWEPNLHSAKESGSIESSCGLLLSAWQDKNASCLNIRVLKSTRGGQGILVKCNFDGARMIITEQSRLAEDN